MHHRRSLDSGRDGDDPESRQELPLIKQVFLWPGATDWQDLWDVDGEITS